MTCPRCGNLPDTPMHEYGCYQPKRACYVCLYFIEAGREWMLNDGGPHKRSTGHDCDSGVFDRTLCPEPCGWMHSYCSICGDPQDECYWSAG